MKDASPDGHSGGSEGRDHETSLEARAHGLALDTDLLRPPGRTPRCGATKNHFTRLVVGVELQRVNVGADLVLIEVLVLGLIHLKPAIGNFTSVRVVYILVAVDRALRIQVLVALAGELVDHGTHGRDSILIFDLFVIVPRFGLNKK